MFVKNFVTSAVISLLVSSSAFAEGQQPPFKIELDTIDYECPETERHCHKGGWHFDYLGMPEVWDIIDVFGDYQNGIPVTNFTVGVIDGSFGREFGNIHAGIDHSVIDKVNGNDGFGTGVRTTHGNMVIAALSAGKVDGGLPTRPMIRAKTAIVARDTRDGRPSINSYGAIQALLNYGERPRIISMSAIVGRTVPYLLDYNKRNPDMPITYSREQLYQDTRIFRQIIQDNPDVLFVFGAGNKSSQAIDQGGMLHRVRYSSDGPYEIEKLNNLIIVASNTISGDIGRTSAFGRDVDIAAPSMYLGVSCANSVGSGMMRAEISTVATDTGIPYQTVYGFDGNVNANRITTTYEEQTGELIPSNAEIIRIGEHKCNERKYPANGTSASVPLVAGAAAILMHAGDLNNFPVSASDAKNLLLNSGRSTIRRTVRDTNTNSESYLNAFGDRVRTMGNPVNPISIPLMNVAKSLNDFLATIPSESLQLFTEDGYTLSVGGADKNLVVRKIDNEVAVFDERKGIFLPPNSTVCMFIGEASDVSFEYSDNNDQLMEIAPLNGECETQTIPESSWQQLDTSADVIPVISFFSNGVSFRLTGNGSGLLIPSADVTDSDTNEFVTVIFDDK